MIKRFIQWVFGGWLQPKPKSNTDIDVIVQGMTESKHPSLRTYRFATQLAQDVPENPVYCNVDNFVDLPDKLPEVPKHVIEKGELLDGPPKIESDYSKTLTKTLRDQNGNPDGTVDIRLSKEAERMPGIAAELQLARDKKASRVEKMNRLQDDD